MDFFSTLKIGSAVCFEQNILDRLLLFSSTQPGTPFFMIKIPSGRITVLISVVFFLDFCVRTHTPKKMIYTYINPFNKPCILGF